MQAPSNRAIEAIGRYQILEELGRGAMAVVYKAYDPSIDRTLAIKVLREERCLDEEYRMRFLREAKAAGMLSHPNIVTVFDVGEINNRPYIVMELLVGEPLDHVLKQNPHLPLEQSLIIAIQLADALDYAHSRGIVHRDIKPSNIILQRDNNAVKITDFGIAHITSNEMTQHTQIGEVLGTPQYMSPEQACGAKSDARTDLFSLGVVLYQMISGRRPFTGDSIATLLLQITTVEAPNLEQVAPATPRSVKLIVERLLRKPPERRFQSGKELSRALKRALDEARELAKAQARPRILPIRVKWTLIMALIVSLTMVVGATLIYKKQFNLMIDQVSEYGGSLSRFMAAESAEKMLQEDWIAIETFAQDAMAGQSFAYITVVDRQGLVRGSSVAQAIGKPYLPIASGMVIAQSSALTVLRHRTDGTEVLDFDAPIQFKGKDLGRIHLGLMWDPLARTANLTVIMMIVLLLTTVIATMVVVYIFGNAVSQPIQTLLKALTALRSGHLEYRISQTRKDEFGEVFTAFDAMADTLQANQELNLGETGHGGSDGGTPAAATPPP